MSIGVGGLMSGLDTESIITRIMQIERRPIVLLQNQEAAFQARISAFGALRGMLSELQSATLTLRNPALFSGFAVGSTRPEIATATATTAAIAGAYQLRVDALARVQQVRSAAFAAGNQVVGTGSLRIQVGTAAAVTVMIDPTNNTLTGIAGAINQVPAGGVVAGVIHDGLGQHFLTLTAQATGSANTISLTITDNDGIHNDARGLSAIYADPPTRTMTQTQAAANARLTINGIGVQRAGNSIDDLITGITLNLKTADPAQTFELRVTHDAAAVSTKVQNFVETYHRVLGVLRTLQAVDPAAGTAGPLQGDGASRLLNSRLHSFLFTRVAGVDAAVNTLSNLGVRLDREGNLSFDAGVFRAAYAAHPAEVRKFFTQSTAGGEGLARQLDSFLGNYTKSVTGLLVAKKQGLNQSVSRVGDQVERIESRLVQREAILRRQFENLELLLGQFQLTAGVLTKQLDALRNLNTQIAGN